MATPDVVFDFTSNNWGLPTSYEKGTTETGYTNTSTGYKITLYSNSGNGFKYDSSNKYLLIGKADAYLKFPEFSFDVEKIEIVGRSGASTSVKQNIYVGTTAVSEETTGAQGTNTYKIARDYQTAGNIYVLKITSSHNTQITKINIYKSSKTLPVSFAEAEKTVYVGDKFSMAATTDVEGTTMTYESSNPGVATVDNSGNVEALATGTATISVAAKADGYTDGTASYTLNVLPKVFGYFLDGKETAGLTVQLGKEFTLPVLSTGGYTGTVEYTTKNSGVADIDINGNVTVKAAGTTTITAAMSSESLTASYVLTVLPEETGGETTGGTYYQKVTSADEIVEGGTYLFIYESSDKTSALAGQNTGYRNAVNITITDDKVYPERIDEAGYPYEVTLEKNANGQYLLKLSNGQYLYFTGTTKGKVYETTGNETNLDENARLWTLAQKSETEPAFKFNSVNSTGYYLEYNASSPRFACYQNTQQYFSIFKKTTAATGVDVTFHEETADGNGNYYSTLYYGDKALKVPEGVTASTCKISEDGSKVTESKAYKVIPAGTAVLLKAKEAKAYRFETGEATETADEANVLKGVDTYTDAEGMKNLAGDTNNNYTYYKLALDGQATPHSIGFYYGSYDGQAFAIKAHTAFIALPGTANAPMLAIGSNNGTTGIDDIKAAAGTDGNAVVYTLSGIRVGKRPLAKGIYIVNGKKMIIK